MRRLILAALIAAAFAFLGRGWGPDASAAPITCPGSQFAEHDKTADGGWDCQNHGGNESGAAKTKNPTD